MEYSPHDFLGNFGLLVLWSTVMVLRTHMEHDGDLGSVPINVIFMAQTNFYFAFLLWALSEAYRQLHLLGY